MQIRYLATVFALFVSVIAGAQVDYGIYTEAKANYQSNDGGYGRDQVLFPAPSLPAVAESRSYVPIGGPTTLGRSDRVTGYDDADAWVKITHPGIEQSYARVGGWSPQGGPPNGLSATTSAASRSKWMAVGPVGQMATIDLNYFLDGWLYAGRSGDWTSNISAHLNVVMRIDRGNGLELMFNARGVLWHSTGLNASFQTMNGWSESKWMSSWSDTSSTLTSVVGNDRMYDLAYEEFIPNLFEVEANTPFDLNYAVTLSAINSVGPTEAFATADFSNTAGMGFSTTTPGFTVEEIGLVPEPSAMIALGAGAVGLLARRRRR